MHFKSAVVVEKSELRSNVENLSLKKHNTYYLAIIKGYAMKSPKEEVYPFFSVNGIDYLVITEDSHLWHFFQREEVDTPEIKSKGFDLDDFFDE